MNENDLPRTPADDILTWQRQIVDGRGYDSSDEEIGIAVACICEVEAYERREGRPYDSGPHTR
jgi:hypothetical protein